MTPIKVQPERAPELARVPPRLLDYTVAVKNPKLQLAFEVARRGEVSEALSERLRVKLLKAASSSESEDEEEMSLLKVTNRER
eukprot:CAMPEP_0185595242 /NCGR_PEP_ID=MMETSP0434-20130131/77772_1 /TAXON_ID=626734 ORGANISM="Favella taraikaensis, Strain Fe Narragansett Bay" /NCGR_SAMPLE_ID=MMETSP0434 /ASSEMBLY_ACC=CAM_ASM_000379 /LENGTH=82 /DNA_ID=CAMNT_0028223129 /DNA_START=124 /DNA_END=376 /DNA_ORIENTATION=-